MIVGWGRSIKGPRWTLDCATPILRTGLYAKGKPIQDVRLVDASGRPLIDFDCTHNQICVRPAKRRNDVNCDGDRLPVSAELRTPYFCVSGSLLMPRPAKNRPIAEPCARPVLREGLPEVAPFFAGRIFFACSRCVSRCAQKSTGLKTALKCACIVCGRTLVRKAKRPHIQHVC